MFINLSKACRVLFLPRGRSAPEVSTVEGRLKRFARLYDAKVYWGTHGRLPLCRSVIAAVLDIVFSMRDTGPVWVSWQFPAERKVAELGTLMHSHSHPSADLTRAMKRRIQAELVTSFGESLLPKEWAKATGKHVLRDGEPWGSIRLPSGKAGHEWDWTVSQLPSRCAAASLAGAEQTAMRAALGV